MSAEPDNRTLFEIRAHDLDPDAMTDEERRAKRRFDAGFVFETMQLPWAAQVGTRRPRFFATREEAEAFLYASGKSGWVAPAFMV